MNNIRRSKSKKYRSALLASVHETAKDLHSAGVMDSRPCASSMSCVSRPYRS